MCIRDRSSSYRLSPQYYAKNLEAEKASGHSRFALKTSQMDNFRNFFGGRSNSQVGAQPPPPLGHSITSQGINAYGSEIPYSNVRSPAVYEDVSSYQGQAGYFGNPPQYGGGAQGDYQGNAGHVGADAGEGAPNSPEGYGAAFGRYVRSATAHAGAFAMEAAGKTSDAFGQAYDILKKQGDDIKEKVRQNYASIRNDLRMDMVDNKIRGFFVRQHDSLNEWVRLKVEGVIIKLLRTWHPKIKESLTDPDMPESLRTWVDDMVDELWPEIENEIILSMREEAMKTYVELPPNRDVFCLFYPWVWLRNWYLYTVDPYDFTIWRQMKWFSWWLILAVSLVPYYGVQTICFFIYFIMIDKSDEYQLVKFILSFKRLQFFTFGCLNGILGYAQYFICTARDESDPKVYSKCIIEGPGSKINYFLDVGGFGLQVALIWLAFIMLSCASREKGLPKFRYVTDDPFTQQHREVRCCCCMLSMENGGRLKGFMIYDIIVAIGVIVAFFVIHDILGVHKEFQAKAAIYSLQICYGLLSFPFLVFLVPSLDTVLTRSRPTAYDKRGNCVPAMKKMRFKPQVVDEETARVIRQEVDVADLYVNTGSIQISRLHRYVLQKCNVIYNILEDNVLEISLCITVQYLSLIHI
eukprot:TRINITY_DN11557_c0_g2_i1.p1 TRINITY_DN11557_c0_g2~~TRINITY_DN11557_c0_g2_i1.p1  ORF type:complete len:636 (+),score=95.96 TRINITY_DN11557_c0_g2_i1:66-1973(+)